MKMQISKMFFIFDFLFVFLIFDFKFVRNVVKRKRLGLTELKTGVSLAAPPYPKAGLQSLPATLRRRTEKPIRAYSKAPGVFPSSRRYPVSSRALHFHRALRRDSPQIVGPFMRAATYAARDYATLTRSEFILTLYLQSLEVWTISSPVREIAD